MRRNPKAKEESLQVAESCFCPQCEEEAFSVTVTGSGSGWSEFGTEHWFEGDGVCSECGYKGYYTASST